eukprot:scaffold98193_cov39-Phaeocystis_antarctica.AAC.1
MNSAVCRRHRGCRRPEAGGGGRGRRLARARLSQRDRAPHSQMGRRNENDTICVKQLLSSSSPAAGRRVQYRGTGFWSLLADIAVRTEKNRTVIHGDDTSLVCMVPWNRNADSLSQCRLYFRTPTSESEKVWRRSCCTLCGVFYFQTPTSESEKAGEGAAARSVVSFIFGLRLRSLIRSGEGAAARSGVPDSDFGVCLSRLREKGERPSG